MVWTGQDTRERWQQRYEAARANLLDARTVLQVRERLVAPSGLVMFGDILALRQVSRVGVFSGSFNPQTLAHAVVTEAARSTQRLDVVLWVMARKTVDKESVDRASLTDRVVQLQAYARAAAPHDAVVVMDAGLYADQADAVQSLAGQKCEVWLIVGFDKVIQIFDARYYTDRDAILRRLFGAAGLLVAPRAGQGSDELAALLMEPANRPFAKQIKLLPASSEVATIASTEARRLMRTDVTSDELSMLLTPEGAALGLATGAYHDIERLQDGTLLDRYRVRNQWLDSIAHTT